MKTSKQCKIIKATYDKLVGAIFEYVIINSGMGPSWFQEFIEKQFKPAINNIEKKFDNFVENEFKPLVNKVDGLAKKVDRIETTLQDHGKRLDRIESTLQEHGKRLDMIETTQKEQGKRLDNVVKKNNLKE